MIVKVVGVVTIVINSDNSGCWSTLYKINEECTANFIALKIII